MRICITFYTPRQLKLPIHYNYLIEAFLYKHINKELADKLHNQGYIYQKRSYKLFVFSRLIGKAKIINKEIIFLDKPKLFVASCIDLFIESLAESLLKKVNFKLSNQEVTVEGIEICQKPEFKRDLNIIRMLSPVTVYSTLTKKNGKKKTYYYNPWESEFSELIRENLLKKYKAFYGNIPEYEEFLIEPLKVLKNQEKMINYKGIWIKGWLGEYKLTASRCLVEFAWNVGLGAKNSQGFGMFDIISDKKGSEGDNKI